MRFASDLLRRCWFLAGPTACGKTDVALALAEILQAERGTPVEIVSLDSMTLYRRMDVGTAKPTREQRARVSHHLFDILEPWQDFSVAEYLQLAESTCREIVERRHLPLFVGGTGLYLRSLLRGVFEGPPANDEVRRRLEADAAKFGLPALHARLRELDPVVAARVHPNDLRRVVRALEVIELTGNKFSEHHQEAPLPHELRPRNVYWLEPPRDWLYARINARVEVMIAAGWLDEVRSLLNEPQPLSHTAAQALGYKELMDHLAGRISLADAITQIQTRTRQFAKRQHTWFRNLEECTAVPISGKESAETIARSILTLADAELQP